jgi:phage shock protein PspC (stress-responsive transcriptional regulator)
VSLSEELERLQHLRAQGALSEAEFQQAKARVLGEPSGATHQALAEEPTFLHRLKRSRTDRVFGGVCGGLGAHTSVPAWAWRALFFLTALSLGFGVIAYLALWLFIPLES